MPLKTDLMGRKRGGGPFESQQEIPILGRSGGVLPRSSRQGREWAVLTNGRRPTRTEITSPLVPENPGRGTGPTVRVRPVWSRGSSGQPYLLVHRTPRGPV